MRRSETLLNRKRVPHETPAIPLQAVSQPGLPLLDSNDALACSGDGLGSSMALVRSYMRISMACWTLRKERSFMTTAIENEERNDENAE